MNKDSLGDRMKAYEEVSNYKLMRRTPVILRLDGMHFHTFTKGFKRPFDDVLISTMQETMRYLCQNIQGCVLGYTQSDEITLLLIDYATLDTQPWFGYRVSKMVSAASSMATRFFNKKFHDNVVDFYSRLSFRFDEEFFKRGTPEYELLKSYLTARDKGADFDCRAFNLPEDDVTNNFLWREQDAIRNAIRSVGYANFPHKQLDNVNNEQLKKMLAEEKGIIFDDLPLHYQRGSCCIKAFTFNPETPEWIIDKNIPIFKGEGRDYIDKLVYLGG